MQVFKTISDMKPPFNPEIALTALLNGEWDDPDLMAYGPILSIEAAKKELKQLIKQNRQK